MPQFDIINFFYFIYSFFILFFLFYVLFINFILPLIWSRFYSLIIRVRCNKITSFINKVKIINLNFSYKLFIEYLFVYIKNFKINFFFLLKYFKLFFILKIKLNILSIKSKL